MAAPSAPTPVRAPHMYFPQWVRGSQEICQAVVPVPDILVQPLKVADQAPDRFDVEGVTLEIAHNQFSGTG